jgi:transposase
MDNNCLFPLPTPTSPLEVLRSEGHVLVRLRGVNVLSFADGDVGATHCAIVGLTETGEVTNRQVAQAFEIHEVYVSRLRGQYRREGSAGLVPPRPGPQHKPKLNAERVEQIRHLKAQGLTHVQVAELVGVSIASVSRALQEAEQLDLSEDAIEGQAQPQEPALIDPTASSGDGPDGWATLETPASEVSDVAEGPGGAEEAGEFNPEEAVPSDPPVAPLEGVISVQHAGAMMLHVPIFQLGLTQAFKTAGANLGPARVHDLAGVLGTLTLGFGLGLANVEQFKLAVRGNLGPMAGLPVAPEVRTLRRKLLELSEQVDTVILSREVTRGLVRMEPVWEGLHYVDGHFTDYHGNLPAPKTRDPKRHCAARGRTDTWVQDILARPLFFLTSPVHDQLVSVMPRVVAEIKALAGDKWDKEKDGPIFLIFDRGGWSPDLFAWLVENDVDFACYVKGHFDPLPDSEFRRKWWFFEGQRHTYDLAETTLTLGEYTYRVIVKRDGGPGGKQIAIITSLDKANPAKIVHLVKLRWRQENGLKDLVHNTFIDGIVEYGGDEEPDPTKILHPEREKLKVQLADLRQQRTALQAGLGEAVMENQESKRPTVRGFKIAHSEQRKKIARLLEQEQQLEKAISQLPARIRRCDLDPSKIRVALRTERRTMVNTLKLSVDNAERWLARKFQTHLKDLDEYRSVLRSLLRQPGELQYDSATSRLLAKIHPPDSPKVREALRGLLQDLNSDSPRTLDGRWLLHFELG